MRRSRRILILAGGFLLVIMLVGTYFVWKIGHEALPDYEQDLTLESIEHKVEVYRDQQAVPHIYAQTEADLYATVGYLMAQDRLWQMDLLRRVTQGRLSEIFGRDMVENDLLMRSLRIPEKSQKVLDRSGERIISALKAFTTGVNEYLTSHKDKLPPEFKILGYKPEMWKPLHSVNLIGYMSWNLTPVWESEIILQKIADKVSKKHQKLLIPVTEEQQSTVFPDFDSDSSALEALTGLLNLSRELESKGLKVFAGSNNWAVSGKKSQTGSPLLANDMHLGLFTPGIWYQMHQVVEGKVNVSGVVLPGQPLVISGHNDTIAWGLTNVMLDDIDFYREKINPEDSNKYRFNDAWKEMEVEQEIVRVKNEEPVKRNLRYTHRGPVIARFKDLSDAVISMKWVGNLYSNELRTIYLLNYAANWQDFKDAVRSFKAISQNIAYADIHGNIGLYCCAGIPIRRAPGHVIYPGETDYYDWKGLVPFDELPYTYNPECGYVSSANNKTVSSDYPYHISHWFDLAPRINRINQMLESRDKLSVQDFMDIQTDHKSLLVVGFIPDILHHAGKIENASFQVKQAIDILDNWQGSYDKTSSAAVIFEHFYVTFVKNLIRDELGKELYREYLGSKILVRNLMKNVWKNRETPWCDDVNTTGRKENFGHIVRRSFIETIDTLTKSLGNDPKAWEWGDLHTLTLKHPIGGEVPVLDRLFDLNRGPYETGGSFHTVCVYSYPFTDPFNVDHGASHRHVYSTADWNQSQIVIPTGVSGIPASRHYCDQTDTYIHLQYQKEGFSKAHVMRNARYHMTISGKK